MSITVFPNDGYDSFISEADADTYFNDRLNAEQWDAATSKETALITAYRSLQQELTIVIDLSDADQLQAIKEAQCEQTLHLLTHDIDSPKLDSLNLGGMVSVKLPQGKDEPARFSPRALNILRPYLRGRSVTRTR